MVTRYKFPGNKKDKAAPAKRISGLTAAARTLGVSRVHLSLVLHGHRQSLSLTKRYQKLTGGKP